MDTSADPKADHRLQAVRALLRGERVTDVARAFGMARSDLYKFRTRALNAMREALKDQPRGPKRAANRLREEKEQRVVALCARYPTMSSYQLIHRLGQDAPNPRTIQRIRARRGLPRVPKRAPTLIPARRLSKRVIRRVQQLIKQKPHLGPERLAWDLQNGEHLQISPSSIKRLKRAMYPPDPPHVWRFYERHHPHSLWHGDLMEKVGLTGTLPVQTAHQLTLLDDYSRAYVFCDLFLEPNLRTTIQALIAAMRQWQVIPKAVVFDNGPEFKGKLLSVFCDHLGIRLIHTSVRHPQTNGKLERAFRDDMKDFYKLYDEWHFEQLRYDLPSYIHYRNYIRGHKALGGKPAITRLREQDRMALPWVLERLERYAQYKMARKVIPPEGCMRLFGRAAYIDASLAGTEVMIYETLEGLEVQRDGQPIALLRGYRRWRHLYWGHKVSKLPSAFYFEPYNGTNCP